MQTSSLHIDPADEIYWASIRSQYAVSADFINLENGYFSIAARPVTDAFDRYNALVNREGAYFMRGKFPQHAADTVKALAAFTGVSPQELILTRNATEAMNILIQGYPFNAQDEVIASAREYDSVVETLEMMKKRGQLNLTHVQLPFHPRHDDEIVALYRQALTPRTRAIVLTHMQHRTGQIPPVARIAQMAREHDVDVFVDAAHSFAQVEYKIPDLDCDFLAANLHKWLGAPLGVGLLYVRRERIADIAPLFGDANHPEDDIRKLSHFGTTPPGAVLAVKDAIAFHEEIGGRNKEARLRYLKDYWTGKVSGWQQIELLTPPERSCAIAAFRVKGVDAREVADDLFKRHRIFTVATPIDDEYAVRVTPHLYNNLSSG